MDLTDVGLREQEARDLAAHVVIEAGLGREAWPIVMLALDAARAEQRKEALKRVNAAIRKDAARIERLMKAVRADSFGDPVIAETLDEAMLSGAGALVAELSSALDAALAEPTG